MKLHASGQAYVRHKGRCIYFGKWGTAEAQDRYDRWKLKKRPRQTVRSLIETYGSNWPKAQPDKIRAILDLGTLGNLSPAEYSVTAFRQHRQRLVDSGTKCARHINDLMRLVVRVFRWGVSMDMVPLDVYTRLTTVPPLQAGEVDRQSRPRQLVRREVVEATLAELSPVPAAIIRLLLLTGARPGEICSMRASEIDKQGPHSTWVYRPARHKTAHHGRRKYIVFGAAGQTILQQCWPTVGDWFFPSSRLVDYYQPASLRQAVGHACTRAGVPHWSPYQIRHLRITELSVDKGLEVAALVAGHSETSTTRGYTHQPDAKALKSAQ